MPRARRPLLFVLFLLQSCGARSALEELESTGSTSASTGTGHGGRGGEGEGGLGPTGGFGGGGSGEGGGSAGGPCEGVVFAPPLVEVDEPGRFTTTAAKLTHFGDDGGDVAVAYQRMPVEAPTSFVEMRHAGFRPWDSWPSSGTLGPAFESYAHPDLAPQFAIGGAPGGMFGMLVGYGSATSFSPRVDAHASEVGPSVTPDGAVVEFASRNARLQLVGAEDLEGRLHVTHVVESSVGFNTTRTALGCSSTGIIADAEPFEDGFLVASSNAGEAAEGACVPEPGLPTRIDFFHIDEVGVATFVGGFDAGGWVTALDAAAHPDGLWVVYVVQAFESAVIQFVRFDLRTSSFVGAGAISAGFDVPLGFAATSLDEDLVVAWGNDPKGNPPDLEISVLDGAGALVGSGSLPDAPGLADPLSIVASPSRRSAVVSGGSGGFPARAWLARFDCL